MNVRLFLPMLLLTGLSWAQTSVPIHMVKRQRVFLQGHCVIDTTHPEVEGRPDLNEKLRALLPPPGPKDEDIPRAIEHIDEDFTVTLNGHGLLSIKGEGLSMHTLDGHPNEAHPTKLFGGLTLDLKTGKAYSLRDMFGPDAYAHLDPLVFQAVAKQVGEELGARPEGPSSYSCVLTPKGVTFYRIFDNFAAGAIQVTIPYAQLGPVIPPGSPLRRFLQG